MSNRLKKTQKTENKYCFPVLLQNDTRFILGLLTCIYMAVIIVALPLYNTGSYLQIGSEKQQFFIKFLQTFQKFLLPFLLLYIILYLYNNRTVLRTQKLSLSAIRSSFSVTDLFVLGYMITVLLSFLASDYRETAVIGNAKWSMGTLTQLSLAVGYFLISRFWRKRLWMAGLMLPVSAVIFVLGYLNRFGIWPIPMECGENAQFISLMGNINWYCGYLVTILFGAVYVAWSHPFSQNRKQMLLNCYLFTGFCALVTNGSSSGILTMLVILLILFFMSVSEKEKLLHYFEIVLTLGLSCLFTYGIRLLFPNAITYQETSNNLFTYTPLPAVITLLALAGFMMLKLYCRRHVYPARTLRTLAKILFASVLLAVVLFICLLTANTLVPGCIGPLSEFSAFTFSPEWGSRRGATWTAGASVWMELPFWKKFVGVGPDCMGDYLLHDVSTSLKTMLTTLWPDLNLSNAHCEWLTVLVNLGLLGLIAFAGIIISSVSSFLRRGMDQHQPYHSVIGACGLAVLAYSVHNIFSFQQVLNEPAMFVILGIGAAYSRNADY